MVLICYYFEKCEKGRKYKNGVVFFEMCGYIYIYMV